MKRHLGSILMMSIALVCALAFYVVSLKVSAERDVVDGLRGAIDRDIADMRALEAELRTRARLPQLQRWNDEVLALGAPAPGQLLRDPLMVASFGTPPAPSVAPMLVAAFVGQVPSLGADKVATATGSNPPASASPRPLARPPERASPVLLASAGQRWAVAAAEGPPARAATPAAARPAPVLAALGTAAPGATPVLAATAPRGELDLGQAITRELDAVENPALHRAALN